MRFERDEAKTQGNLVKPRLELADAAAVFRNEAANVQDDTYDYGEERFVTFGILNGVIVSTVHTESDNLVKVISFRKATPNEARY